VHRLETYETIMPEKIEVGYPEHPWSPCEPFRVYISENEAGSVLSVKSVGECESADGGECSVFECPPWWMRVDMRDLGFLVP
jgi:hypothetical protein